MKRKTRHIVIWSISAGGVAFVCLSCACGVGLWWWAPWATTPLGKANLLGPATPNVQFEKTVTLMPGAVNRYDFPAAALNTWVSVEVDSPEPVTAHITGGSLADDVRNALERNQIPKSASGKRMTKDSFATGVPLNMTVVVFLSGAQKQTNVKLKVTTRPQTKDDGRFGKSSGKPPAIPGIPTAHENAGAASAGLTAPSLPSSAAIAVSTG